MTSANFAEILPVVKEALNECTFWAIDNEFTGLSMGKPNDTIDSLEERYEKLANGWFVFVSVCVCLRMSLLW